MPPRKWRTLPPCAALLLATTSCAVGPTIHDTPKKPAAATAGATAQSSSNQAQPGGPAVSGTAPGADVSLPSNTSSPKPSPVQVKFTIGGGVPFVFTDGTRIEVLAARIDQSLAGVAKGGLVPVVIHTRIVNGTDKELWAYRLAIHVLGCGQPVQQCTTIEAPAAADEVRKYLQPGATETVDWFIGVSPEHVGALTVRIRDPKSGSAEFTGSAT